MPLKHLHVNNVPKGLREMIIWSGTWNPFTKNVKHLNAQFVLTNLRENTIFLSIFLLFTPKSNRMDAINANRAFYRYIVWFHEILFFYIRIICNILISRVFVYRGTIWEHILWVFISQLFMKNQMVPNPMYVPFVNIDSSEKIIWKNTWKRFMKKQELMPVCYVSYNHIGIGSI